MKNSAIQWTTHTFNPWIGCTKVAPECKNCYAEEQQDHRYGRVKWGKGQPRHRTSETYWKQPLKWNREAADSAERLRVFCASLADVFDEEVDVNWRLDLFSLISQTPNLDWLLLTKRPAAAKRFLDYGGKEPYQNVWLGVSAGVDPAPLLDIPATVHFLSCEPMLKPLDDEQAHITQKFDWIIFGGESGKHARECKQDWIRHGLEFCDFYSIPAFVKQLGANSTFFGKPSDHGVIEYQAELQDSHGGDISEWPEDLRVRQFPKA